MTKLLMNITNEIMDSNFNVIKSELGRNLFIARKALGLSHIELVKSTGLTRPVISTIENGNSNPTFSSIIKLSTFLCISNEMLTLTEKKFKTLQRLLRQSFANYMLNETELYIPKKDWNSLLKYSDVESRRDIGKIAQICKNIITINYPNEERYLYQNIILGAALGVIYQSDGFNAGLNFGAWLGKNFS